MLLVNFFTFYVTEYGRDFQIMETEIWFKIKVWVILGHLDTVWVTLIIGKF